MDKFTVRGLVYSSISGLGLCYEIFFVQSPRVFLMIMYTIVVGIGLLCIFALREDESRI